MRPSRSLAAGVAGWLVVVAVGSALAWAVISRAGEEVVSSEAPVPTAQPEQASQTQQTDEPTQPSSTGPSPSPTDPSSSPTSEGPPEAEAVRRTWVGVGGQVTVECVGPAAGLASLIADSGFGYEIDDEGPQRVRVEFEGRGDNDDERARVDATCVDGEPTFDADVDVD